MNSVNRICQKRLAGDMKLLLKDPPEFIEAYPDDKDMLIWYFLVKGPEFSDYKGGYYLGKIMHNPEYPFKPPDFMMLTPSGRFLTDQKICLSNSSYHSNEWSSMWNIKAILTGFLSIMLDDNEHGISHISRPKDEKMKLAKESVQFNKDKYPDLIKKFTRLLDEKGDPRQEVKKEEPKKKEDKKETKKDSKPVKSKEEKVQEDIQKVADELEEELEIAQVEEIEKPVVKPKRGRKPKNAEAI